MADVESEMDAIFSDDPRDNVLAAEPRPHYSHVLYQVASTPWAILPAKFAVIAELLALRASGQRLSVEEIRERIGAASPSSQQRPTGSVAVLPLHGTLIPRADLMTEMSGGTSLERWTAAFRGAVADPNVSAIVIDVDSPGGSVFGVEEAANVVFGARGSKPIVAVADTLAASAAYWIATQADELVVSPSAEVGSIGVFGAHQDLSAALEKAGVKVSLISAGKFKTEGNPFEPLGEEARAAMQARVDDYYAAFTKAVARGRGTTSRAVRDGFGQGRVEGASQAVALGMADQVATLEDTIRRVASGKRLNGSRAAMQFGSEAQTITINAPLQVAREYDLTDVVVQVEAAILSALSAAQKIAAAPSEPVAGPSLDLRRRRLRRRALA